MTKLILKRQLQKNKKKGFTLIELIVVIVIIAIIAAIAVPALTRYIGQAEMRALQAQGHNIQLVLQAERTERYGSGTAAWPSGTSIGADSTVLKWPPTFPDDMTYEQILNAAGVNIRQTETLSGITWNDTTLAFFYLYTETYILAYFNDAGFRAVAWSDTVGPLTRGTGLTEAAVRVGMSVPARTP